MTAKAFFTQIIRILLVIGVIAIASGIAYGSEDQENLNDPSIKNSGISGAQLQSHLMNFTDRFVSILDTVIAQFESRRPQGKIRYEILELITLSAHNAYIIAGDADPDVALLDMFSLVTLGRLFFEEDGDGRYGDLAAPVLEGYRKAEADIRNVAALKLSPDQISRLMTMIQSWRKHNPDVKGFPLIRFSNFAADNQDSTLSEAEIPDGLIESVEAASETAEEMRLLAERSVYMATRMPQLMGLFGDLWLTRWMNTPDMQKARAEFELISHGTDRLVAVAEKLPDLITKEREATIRLLMAYVSQERNDAVEQLISGISTQRKAAQEVLIKEEREIEDRITLRLVFLMLIGMVGYIAANLFVRYISNRMAVFGTAP